MYGPVSRHNNPAVSESGNPTGISQTSHIIANSGLKINGQLVPGGVAAVVAASPSGFYAGAQAYVFVVHPL